MVTGRFHKTAGELSVRVRGNIVSTNAERIGAAISGILKEHGTEAWRGLRLDLKSVKMVDSVGLNLILVLVRKLKADNRTVTIFVRESAVERVFQVAKLDTIVPVVRQIRDRG
jgi:anti-anti-sigma factor